MSQIQPIIHMILQKVYYHQNNMQQQCEQLKYHSEFVIFDNCITVKIKQENNSFLNDTF